MITFSEKLKALNPGVDEDSLTRVEFSGRDLATILDRFLTFLRMLGFTQKEIHREMTDFLEELGQFSEEDFEDEDEDEEEPKELDEEEEGEDEDDF